MGSTLCIARTGIEDIMRTIVTMQQLPKAKEKGESK
jgi:hypothetical protein